MNEVFIITMNLRFNTKKEEYAFASKSKARMFFNGLVADLKSQGYNMDVWKPKVPLIQYAKLSKPSDDIEGAIDTAYLSLKRVAFYE